ncbi:MAG: sensory protein TspO, partial [Chitinivibrionales bacterium]|nr:sensory protein TspO [Chitinivibrionales bacterium]
RRPGWAFVEILLLVAAIIATIVLFARISKAAALLLLPYLAWTLFATVLNGSIWVTNR